MSDHVVKLSDEEGQSVDLLRAQLIGISASAKTERDRGESTVRFLVQGDDAMGENPFKTLSPWHYDGVPLTLGMDDLAAVGDCRLRECTLNPSTRSLYVQVYTRFPAQQVRHWLNV